MAEAESKYEFSKKVAFVTGGAGGIGSAICDAFLSKKVKVCLMDIREDQGRLILEQLILKHGSGNAHFIVGDVTNEEQFEAAVIEAKEKFGHLDILINNAGVIGEQNWRRTVEVNLNGTIIGILLALRHLVDCNGEKGGVVINHSSNLGLYSNHFTPTYCTTKHAIIGLTKSWGDKRNFLRTRVKVNAICPYATDTPLFYKFYEDCVDLKSASEHKNVTLPMKPLVVANAFIRLIEDNKTGAVATIKSETEGLQYIDFKNI